MLISRKLYSTAINFIKRITTYGDNQARDKLRRARVPELPNNYLRLDRTSLYHLAANLPTTVSRLTISRHLYKLRNFGTASAIVKTLDFSTLAPKDAIFVIQCLASSNAGVEADYKLQSLFRGCNFSFSENLIPTLCERIRFSGLAVDQKLEILRKLSHDIPQFPYTVAREAINWCDYTVKTQAGISCNVLDYVHENTSLKFFLRAIPHLKISGHHELVAGKLQDFYQCGHSGDFSLISALAEHVPDWLNDNDAIFARFVRDHLLRPTTLDLLGRLPKTDLVQALFWNV